MKITDYMKDHIVYLDGGMGTLLQKQGLKPGEHPERWNLSHPEVITAIHRDYFDAGSIANPVINWDSGADIDYFSYTSFARYRDLGTTAQNIRIAADSLIN